MWLLRNLSGNNVVKKPLMGIFWNLLCYLVCFLGLILLCAGAVCNSLIAMDQFDFAVVGCGPTLYQTSCCRNVEMHQLVKVEMSLWEEMFVGVVCKAPNIRKILMLKYLACRGLTSGRRHLDWCWNSQLITSQSGLRRESSLLLFKNKMQYAF